MKLNITRGRLGVVVMATTLVMAAFVSGTSSASTSATAKQAWTIALSNGYSANAAEAQLMATAKAYAASPSVAPHVKSFTVNSAGVSVAAQAATIDGLIAKHVNAILLDCNSLTGLNSAIAAAHKAGIVVVAYNDLCNSPYVYQIQTVGQQFGTTMMKGLVSLLHGHGNIVELRGIAGNAVDAAEASGFNAVVAKNPGIHVLNVSYAQWDDAQAQQIMGNLLSRYSNINGVFTEGGMQQGVVRAYVTAKRKFVPVTGTDENGFACQLKQYHSQGLTGVQVGSQLWESAYAMKIALAILSGQHEPHFIPVAPVSWGTAQAINLCQPKLSQTLFLQFDNPKVGVILSANQVVKYMG